MIYAYEWIDGEWVICGCSQDLQTLNMHCESLGIELFATIGGW